MTKKRPKRADERTELVGAFVPAAVRKVILQIADNEGVTVSYAARQLLEESPRVKRGLKTLQTAEARA
jgi:hypothetical protein